MPLLRCNPVLSVHASSLANTSLHRTYSIAIQFVTIEYLKHFSIISKIVLKSTKILQFYQEFDLFQTESITTL